MAQINSDDGSFNALKQFWSASSLLTLTTSLRLIRNFKHYNPQRNKDDQPDPNTIDQIWGRLRSAMHSYRGLLSQYHDQESNATASVSNWFPALIALREHIYQQWYHLHQQLLFFPADQIAELIPSVDSQLKLWRHDTDAASDSEIVLSDSDFQHSELLRMQLHQQWRQITERGLV
ncbi:MAG: hypothetical protein ACQETE_09500 [Bacteroidota bacterium]